MIPDHVTILLLSPSFKCSGELSILVLNVLGKIGRRLLFASPFAPVPIGEPVQLHHEIRHVVLRKMSELGLLNPNSLFDRTSALEMAFTIPANLSLLHVGALMSLELAEHVKSTVHGFCGFVNFN